MKKRLLSLAVISAFAQANDQSTTTTNDVSGFYLGGGLGTTTVETDANWYNDPRLDSSDNSYKLIAGYQINRIVGIETQYTRYGDIYSKNLATRQYIKPENFAVMANLGYTFDSGWRPFGTIGLGKTELSAFGDSLKETSVHVGVGGEYSPKELKNLNFRLAYEVDSAKFDKLDDTTVTLGTFYLGASYKF